MTEMRERRATMADFLITRFGDRYSGLWAIRDCMAVAAGIESTGSEFKPELPVELMHACADLWEILGEPPIANEELHDQLEEAHSLGFASVSPAARAGVPTREAYRVE